MAYVIVEEGAARFYSLAKLLDDNPEAVLSDPPTEAELAAYSVYPITVEAKPSYNPVFQKVVALPLSNATGSWVLGWEVVDLTEEEIEAAKTPDALLQNVSSVQVQVETVTNEVAAVKETVATVEQAATAAAGAAPSAYGWAQDRFVGANHNVVGCTAELISSGTFRITFDTPFDNVDDYIVLTTGVTAHQYVIVDQRSATSFRIRTTDTGGTTVPAGFCQFVVFGL